LNKNDIKIESDLILDRKNSQLGDSTMAKKKGVKKVTRKFPKRKTKKKKR